MSVFQSKLRRPVSGPSPTIPRTLSSANLAEYQDLVGDAATRVNKPQAFQRTQAKSWSVKALLLESNRSIYWLQMTVGSNILVEIGFRCSGYLPWCHEVKQFTRNHPPTCRHSGSSEAVGCRHTSLVHPAYTISLSPPSCITLQAAPVHQQGPDQSGA